MAILSFILLSTAGCHPREAPVETVPETQGAQVTVVSQAGYTVHQELSLVNEGPGEPDKQNIWVALIPSFPPYQQVTSMEVFPSAYELVVDEYGNRYAEFDFSNHPAGDTLLVKIDYQVTVNELAYDLSACRGELPGEYLQPEVHIESANPQIEELAGDLSRGRDTPCEQVEAFYDYAGDELVYTYNGEDWGAQATMGLMGSDCTEYTSLLVALSRAQGIPSRYFTGLLYLDEGTGTLARVEHAWPDVYLPSIGWVALDPTLGRSQGNRAEYFAHHSPDHIIVTLGANPSVLRGSSYWTHLYWPGDSTRIRVEGGWSIQPVTTGKN